MSTLYEFWFDMSSEERAQALAASLRQAGVRVLRIRRATLSPSPVWHVHVLVDGHRVDRDRLDQIGRPHGGIVSSPFGRPHSNRRQWAVWGAVTIAAAALLFVAVALAGSMPDVAVVIAITAVAVALVASTEPVQRWVDRYPETALRPSEQR